MKNDKMLKVKILAERGYSTSEISKQLFVCPNTVRNYAKELGIKLVNLKPFERALKEHGYKNVYDFFAKNNDKTFQQMSEELDIGYSYISRHYKKYETELKKKFIKQ